MLGRLAITERGDAERLGKAIQARRNKLGLTQTQIAAKVGYEPRSGGVTISKIEHGVISPPLSRLSRIAEALDTTPEDLLEEAGLSTTPARLERLASMNEEFGNSTVRQAANDAVENDITTESQLLDARTQEAWTSLTAAHDRVRDEFLIPFVSVAARVQGTQDQRTVGVTLSAGDTKQERLNLQREELKREG